jgi:hypothetical protein
MAMKSFKDQSCIEPWRVLYPDCHINSLQDEMNSKYNNFYLQDAEKNSISFKMCLPGYIITPEGSREPFTYQGY